VNRVKPTKSIKQWKLADAKNRFSEVVNRALAEGPQQVQRRGDSVMILAQRDYEKLTGTRIGFREFLLSAPSLTGLNLERDRSPMRDVKL
jgi:prevent-host-death family protein